MSPAIMDTCRSSKAERIRRVGGLAKGKCVSAKFVPEVLGRITAARACRAQRADSL